MYLSRNMLKASSISIVSAPTGGDLVRQENSVAVYIDQTNIGTGKLYIAQSCIVWHSEVEDEAFRLHYPDITLHGVSRDTATFPYPCIYLMVDASKNDIGRLIFKAKNIGGVLMDTAGVGSSDQHDNEDDDDDEEGDDDDDESRVTEVRFIPQNVASLDTIDEVISDCNALHPDEDDSNSEDDNQFDEGGSGDGPEEGAYEDAEEAEMN